MKFFNISLFFLSFSFLVSVRHDFHSSEILVYKSRILNILDEGSTLPDTCVKQTLLVLKLGREACSVLKI